MSWKSILKFIIGLAVIIGIFWGGYFLWGRIVAQQTANSTLPPTQPGLPKVTDIASAPKIAAETKNPIFDYWVNSLTGAIYYLNPGGQVFKKSETGEEAVNSQVLDKLNNIQPSPDGSLAFAEFNYPNQPVFSVFNTVSNSWQPLPDGTIAAAWATSSQQLAYAENKNNSGDLKILNIASQKTQEIIKLNQKDLKLYWTRPGEIFFLVSASTADYPSSLWSVNLRDKTLRPLIKDEPGLAFNWSLNGNFGLKLISFQRVPKISLVDGLGNVQSDFSFITLPEKCVFDKDKVYCAVPRFIKDGLVLPDDYYKKSVYFQDDLYAIDLSTGAAALVLSGNEMLFDARHLAINNGKLYFLNRYDDKLYSLAL